MEKLNLFQKLQIISEKVGYVAKNIDIAVGATKYKAVGELDVITAVKPVEVEFGIFSYPTKHEVVESKELEKANGRVEQFVRVKTTYRFVDIDNPAEFIETTALGDGVDSGDKASGKAQTYADKYALLKAYKIMTGDDPDLEPSGEYKKSSKGKTQQPAAAEKKAVAPTEEQPPFMVDQFETYGARMLAVEKITKLLNGSANDTAKWLAHYKVTAETLTPSVAETILNRIKEKQAKNG